jgi:hypothetical protein
LPEAKEPQVDVGTAIAQMVIEQSFTRRKMVREHREVTTRALASAQKQELQEMEKAAEAKHSASMADAWGTALSGGVRLAGAGVGMLGGAGAKPWLSETTRKAVNDAGASAGDVGKGVSVGFSAAHNRDAAQAESAAKGQANAAQEAKRSLEGMDDELRDARDSARKALDFVRDFNAAKQASQSAALRRA